MLNGKMWLTVVATVALTCLAGVQSASAAFVQVDPLDMTATASSTRTTNGDYSAQAVVNGSGLSGDEHSSSTSSSTITMWMSNTGTVAGRWLKIDLGDVYNVAELKVWNFNRNGYTGRGVAQADIYTATTDPGDPPTGWTLTVEDQAFSEATGLSSYSTADTIAFDTPVSARYIAFVIDSNHNGSTSDFVGLSEVQVFATEVPEPATLALLGIGGLALGGGAVRRRRRA